MATMITMATMASMVTIAKTVPTTKTVTTARMVTMAIAGFLLQDKLGKVRFFQETFLVADTRTEMVWSWGCYFSPSVVQTYGLQRARLDIVHGCKQPSGWNSSVQRNLLVMHVASIWGSVSEIKNVLVTIPAVLRPH